MSKDIDLLYLPDWVELYVLLFGFISKNDIKWEFDLDDYEVEDIVVKLRARLVYYWFVPYEITATWLIQSTFDETNLSKWLYLFTLILSVYWNRFEHTVAWKLFERLSNEVFAFYLWWDSFVVGAPNWQKGITLVEDIANRINERRGAQNPWSAAQDEKLDIVTTKQIDVRQNKLILFSQCAAGHNWASKLTQLSLYKWQQYINFWVQPLRWFSCTVLIDDEGEFYKKWLEGGLIFDRARIMRFLLQLRALQDNQLERDIANWLELAAWKYDFNLT